MIYNAVMKNTIFYRLYTVLAYTATAAFIALVCNGLMRVENIVATVTGSWQYLVYWYVLLTATKELITDTPSRVLLSTVFVALTLLAHVALSGVAAAVVALAAPLLALGLYVLAVYVLKG